MNGRPMYESARDRENEAAVAAILAPRWKSEAQKLPMAYYIDWLMMRGGKPVACMEVKCRNNPRAQYPTLMLSLAKWMHGLQFSELMGIPFLVAVQWTDGIFWHKAGSFPVSFGFGGRKDRGDSQDMEPVVFIPTDAFVPLAR